MVAHAAVRLLVVGLWLSSVHTPQPFPRQPMGGGLPLTGAGVGSFLGGGGADAHVNGRDGEMRLVMVTQWVRTCVMADTNERGGGGHRGGCEAVWKGRILPLSRGADQHLWLARRFPSQCDLDVGEESKDTVDPYRCQRRQRRPWLESSTTRAEGGVNRDTSKRSQDSSPSDIQRRQQDARRNAPRIAIVITRLGRIFHGVSASSTSPDPDCCPVSYFERGPLRQC